MSSQAQVDASSSTTPSLYSIGRHTLSEPIGALRNVLEAIEGKRRQLATALDPCSNNLDELLDCLLMLADVRCEARSENMFHQSSSLVGYLRKRAKLVRGLASLAALGPEYDPALDRGAWTAVGERRSARPQIPFVYLRSLEATVREHLAWSVSFEQRFPASALEERSFRARLADLDPDLIVRRFYVGWTARDPLVRAQEDQALIQKGELRTQFGNYMSSIGRGQVEDLDIFALDIPSSTVHRLQGHALTQEFEAFIIALLGPECLNSASGGTTTRWTPNEGLIRVRDELIASLDSHAHAQAAEAKAPATSSDGPWAAEKYVRTQATIQGAIQTLESVARRHFQDLQGYFKSNPIPSSAPEECDIQYAYFEAMILSACAVPTNQFGQAMSMNVFEVPSSCEFTGATRFFGDIAGNTALFHRRSLAFTFKVGDNASDSLDSELDTARRLSPAGVGFVDAVPVLDTSRGRVSESMFFLRRFLLSVVPTPLIVIHGVKATKLVLALKHLDDTNWSSAEQEAFNHEFNSGGFSTSSFRAVDNLPSWGSITLASFTRDQVGNLLVIEIAPGVWRIILVQLHHGSFVYDPVIASARQELVSLVRFKQLIIQRLLQRRDTSDAVNKTSLLALREEVQAFSEARGLERSIIQQRQFVAERETALGALRVERRRGDGYAERVYIVERRAQLSDVSSKTMKRQVTLTP